MTDIRQTNEDYKVIDAICRTYECNTEQAFAICNDIANRLHDYEQHNEHGSINALMQHIGLTANYRFAIYSLAERYLLEK